MWNSNSHYRLADRSLGPAGGSPAATARGPRAGVGLRSGSGSARRCAAGHGWASRRTGLRPHRGVIRGSLRGWQEPWGIGPGSRPLGMAGFVPCPRSAACCSPSGLARGPTLACCAGPLVASGMASGSPSAIRPAARRAPSTGDPETPRDPRRAGARGADTRIALRGARPCFRRSFLAPTAPGAMEEEF
jgi:hypothetical protein